jgi:hypothetical protein
MNFTMTPRPLVIVTNVTDLPSAVVPNAVVLNVAAPTVARRGAAVSLSIACVMVSDSQFWSCRRPWPHLGCDARHPTSIRMTLAYELSALAPRGSKRHPRKIPTSDIARRRGGRTRHRRE